MMAVVGRVVSDHNSATYSNHTAEGGATTHSNVRAGAHRVSHLVVGRRVGQVAGRNSAKIFELQGGTRGAETDILDPRQYM